MKNLKIYYTSDTHGFLLPIDYATGNPRPSGVLAAAACFEKDENTLVIDGGDSIQGSPFTMYISKHRYKEHPVAQVFNEAAYDFVTLGNHDFNYGQDQLLNYLETLTATCLCANIIDQTGKLPIKSHAIKVLPNGLKVGLVGAVTHWVPVWEKREHLEHITFVDPVAAMKKELEAIKDEVDITIGIYHGGFAKDINTGAILSETDENLAYDICQQLDFDILLTGHQHMPVEGQDLFGTFIVQPLNNASHFLQLDVNIAEDGQKAITSAFKMPHKVVDYSHLTEVAQVEASVAKWLDAPVGYLDQPLRPQSKVEMALNGSIIADFFNQVQLEVTGADLSITALGNEVKGFDQEVTVRDVVSTYIYPNTVITKRVTGADLKIALERVASYLEVDETGSCYVSDRFLKPKVEHYNFDMFANLTYRADLKAPVGKRIVEINALGKPVQPEDVFTLAMNNYRATGAGGYEVYANCETVKEEPMEMAELIINYLDKYKNVKVKETEKSQFFW